jgi:hypothetical protein
MPRRSQAKLRTRGVNDGARRGLETPATSDHCRACALTASIQEAHLAAGNGVQIIGKVNPDLSVKVLSSIDLGTGVGESLFTFNLLPQRTAGVAKQYPNLFGRPVAILPSSSDKAQSYPVNSSTRPDGEGQDKEGAREGPRRPLLCHNIEF